MKDKIFLNETPAKSEYRGLLLVIQVQGHDQEEFVDYAYLDVVEGQREYDLPFDLDCDKIVALYRRISV